MMHSVVVSRSLDTTPAAAVADDDDDDDDASRFAP